MAAFRYNDDCAPGITALAVSAVPSLMRDINSLPVGLLNTLLTTLFETTKVRYFLTMAETIKLTKLSISAVNLLISCPFICSTVVKLCFTDDF